MAFASSVDSPANCGALYFFFRPDLESGVDALRPTGSFRMGLCSVPNNSPCGLPANLGYEIVLISEQASGSLPMAFSRMEYEDAVPGDSNSALHCAKATP